jgi:hypothetical protein
MKSAENINRRFAAGDLQLINRYHEGHLHIELKMASGTDAAEYDLILGAVPSRHRYTAMASNAPPLHMHSRDDSDRDQELMFVGVTEAVQGPQGIIPSLVWIERSKERQDFIRDVVAAFAANDIVKPGRVITIGNWVCLGSTFPERMAVAYPN